MRITVKLDEKKTRELLAELVPKLLETRKLRGHELVITVDENESVRKGFSIYEGKKEVGRSESGITMKGRQSEVILTGDDLEKIRKVSWGNNKVFVLSSNA